MGDREGRGSDPVGAGAPPPARQGGPYAPGWPPPPQYPVYPRYPGYPPPGNAPVPPPPPAKPSLRDTIGLRGWGVILLVPLFILLALYLAMVFVGRPYVVRGASMYPTLHEGDRVFVMKYRFSDTPDRGDVVVLKDIGGQTELLIKRVVAIGGDRLTMENGKLVVNDKYIHKSSNTRVSEPYTQLVPDNSVFVMGDNEARSYDSRMFGPVSLDKVMGKAAFIFWPPGDAGDL